jgi:hypothetical protein
VAPKAALKTIKIYFDSWNWDCTRYSWDRMDEIREQAVRSLGLDLVYNEPTMVRKVCLNYVETGSLDCGQKRISV